MGTSGTYGGPKSGLEPPWIDDADGSDGSSTLQPDRAPDGTDDGSDGTEPNAQPEPKPSPLNNPLPSLSSPRGSFTRFANSGKTTALSKAVKGYLASTGGGAGAARRMPSSRHVASGIAGLASRFATQGAAESLLQFNLQDLAGRPATEVFEALVDHLCPVGGTIDEAIARDTMIEAISVFAEDDLGDFDQLSPDEFGEFLAEVITRSITTKIINEIGTNSLHSSKNDSDFRQAEATLRDYTAGAVRDVLGSSFNAQEQLTTRDIEQRISTIFGNSFELLEAMLEEE